MNILVNVCDPLKTNKDSNPATASNDANQSTITSEAT